MIKHYTITALILFVFVLGLYIGHYFAAPLHHVLDDQWTEITIAREQIELICIQVGCIFE